jgi:WD40 repeat protein
VKESFPLNGQVKAIGLSNDEGRLYIATANPEEHPTLDIYTWNLTEDSPKGPLFTIGKHRDNITAIQFMPSIGSIFTSSYDRTTKRWSAESGELQHTYNFENILTATGKVAIVEGFNPIALKIE